MIELSRRARTELTHRVRTYRDAGLEAKWGKRGNGTPVIFVRNPKATAHHQRETWWTVDDSLFQRAKVVGVLQAFDEATSLGDIFSIPA